MPSISRWSRSSVHFCVAALGFTLVGCQTPPSPDRLRVLAEDRKVILYTINGTACQNSPIQDEVKDVSADPQNPPFKFDLKEMQSNGQDFVICKIESIGNPITSWKLTLRYLDTAPCYGHWTMYRTGGDVSIVDGNYSRNGYSDSVAVSQIDVLGRPAPKDYPATLKINESTGGKFADVERVIQVAGLPASYRGDKNNPRVGILPKECAPGWMIMVNGETYSQTPGDPSDPTSGVYVDDNGREKFRVE